MKLPQYPKSEAALKWVIKNWGNTRSRLMLQVNDVIPVLYVYSSGKIAAEIDLREIVRKRQPLTGIKKQMSGIVQGKKQRAKK